MKTPEVLPNWKRVLRYAWSVRLMALAALFAGLEVAVPLLADQFPPHVFAVLSGLVAAGGVIARVISQRKLRDQDDA